MKRPISHSINLKFNCPITSLSTISLLSKNGKMFRKSIKIPQIFHLSWASGSAIRHHLSNPAKDVRPPWNFRLILPFPLQMPLLQDIEIWGVAPTFFDGSERDSKRAKMCSQGKGTTSRVIFSLRTVKVSVKRQGDEWMP